VLEKVCMDLDGESAWYYEPTSQIYSRITPTGSVDTAADGKLLAHLHGRDIPNPDILWLRRCEAAGTTTSSMDGLKFKPSPTTYALFTHWEGVKDA
jgi:hypothetical protein